MKIEAFANAFPAEVKPILNKSCYRDKTLDEMSFTALTTLLDEVRVAVCNRPNAKGSLSNLGGEALLKTMEQAAAWTPLKLQGLTSLARDEDWQAINKECAIEYFGGMGYMPPWARWIFITLSQCWRLHEANSAMQREQENGNAQANSNTLSIDNNLQNIFKRKRTTEEDISAENIKRMRAEDKQAELEGIDITNSDMEEEDDEEDDGDFVP